MTMRLAVLLMILAAAAGAVAQDQPDKESERRMDQVLSAPDPTVRSEGRGTNKQTPPPGSLGSPAAAASSSPRPVVPECPAQMSAETEAACQAAWREYLAYFKSGLTHREQVFAWQLFSSRIIFWGVLSLVALGMYFAAVQFQRGLRRKPSATTPEDVTEFAASLAGVKVRSPVLGVLILVISFAFFYLYLRFVYPVTTTF